jgi:nucleotide-binding universal stress UspA family protein
MNFRKILIAIDDSAQSMKAARAGFSLAHDLKAMIAIVFVVDKSKEVFNADLGITTEQSKILLLEDAEKTIEQLIKMYDKVDSVVRFTPEGDPKQEILAISKVWGADIIVMGRHSRSGFERMFTGSTSQAVIKRSEIPVMIVPSELE